MKKLSEGPCKKESKVDDTQANIREGENTNQKTLCSKSAHTFGLFFRVWVLNL